MEILLTPSFCNLESILISNIRDFPDLPDLLMLPFPKLQRASALVVT